MSAIRRVARAPGARAPGTWSTGDTPRRTGCSHSRLTSSSTIMIFFRWKYFCSVISFYLSVGHAVLQVTGSSFYLWVLECYPCMVKLVEFLMQEVTNWLWPRDIKERDLLTDCDPRPSSEGAAAMTPSVSAEVAERLRRTRRWHPRSPRKLCSQFSASAVVQLEVRLIAFALLLKCKKSSPGAKLWSPSSFVLCLSCANINISSQIDIPCRPHYSAKWNVNHSIYIKFRCGTVQFKSILEYLESMEDEMDGLKEKVSDFSASHRAHEEKCINDDITTTNKLNSMNQRVRE